MKIFYSIIILLLLSTVIKAQENIIKISPIGMTYGKYNVQYQRVLTDYTSVNISASYLKPNLYGLDDQFAAIAPDGFDFSLGISGAAFSADYRLYSQNKTGAQGFYIAPYLRYTGVGLVTKVAENTSGIGLKTGFSVNRFGFGLKLGAQWMIKDIITIDWNFGGLGADLYHMAVYGEINQPNESGTGYETIQDKDASNIWLGAFSTGFTVGYAF